GTGRWYSASAAASCAIRPTSRMPSRRRSSCWPVRWARSASPRRSRAGSTGWPSASPPTSERPRSAGGAPHGGSPRWRPVPATEEDRPDLELALLEEVDRLPEKYRLPIVLCYLEGLTHEAAARRLSWPVGTVEGRLARARGLLRSRLTRRGLAPAIGLLAA